MRPAAFSSPALASDIVQALHKRDNGPLRGKRCVEAQCTKRSGSLIGLRRLMCD